MFLTAPAFILAQDAVIHAGHLILPDQGQVIDNQYITLSDGVIRSVSGELPQNWKGEVINLKNSWVMPGLIDCHTHITLDFPPGDFDFSNQMAKESNALRALIGLKHAGELLRAGFTTIKEVGNDGNYVAADITRRDSVRRAHARRGG